MTVDNSIGTIITYTGNKPGWVQVPDMYTANMYRILYILDLSDEEPSVTYTNSFYTPVMYPMHNIILKNII